MTDETTVIIDNTGDRLYCFDSKGELLLQAVEQNVKSEGEAQLLLGVEQVKELKEVLENFIKKYDKKV